MQRESDKHGRVLDEELKHELDPALRGSGPSRTEEWPDPEAPEDGDPGGDSGDSAVPPFDKTDEA